MPISMKFSTGLGSARFMANPMPAEASSIVSITASAARCVRIFRISLPAANP